MTELQKLKIAAYDLIVKMQLCQNELSTINQKIAELVRAEGIQETRDATEQ